VKGFEGRRALIEQSLKNKETVLFLGEVELRALQGPPPA